MGSEMCIRDRINNVTCRVTHFTLIVVLLSLSCAAFSSLALLTGRRSGRPFPACRNAVSSTCSELLAAYFLRVLYVFSSNTHSSWLTGFGRVKFLDLSPAVYSYQKAPSRGRTDCYLFTVSNSGLLPVQRQTVTDTAAVTDTCGVNSIDFAVE